MDRNGFSLIELMVAVVIFAVGILGVAKMQLQAAQGNAYGLQMLNAVNVANNTIEELQQEPLLSSGAYTSNFTTSGTKPVSVDTYQGVHYYSTWSVSSIGSSTARQVTVTVQWPDSKTHTINIPFVKGMNK